ncbi:hypothetical protein QUA70_02860 [Microcoleus sp. LAD1_D5]|uniref:hypothetical protein n=1 Tax=unclassified Microcoleus TaxID=2642155 RepID=UPI002FD62FD5
MTSKIPELTNYSVKQKLDRVQPQQEFLGQFFYYSIFHVDVVHTIWRSPAVWCVAISNL